MKNQKEQKKNFLRTLELKTLFLVFKTLILLTLFIVLYFIFVLTIFDILIDIQNQFDLYIRNSINEELLKKEKEINEKTELFFENNFVLIGMGILVLGIVIHNREEIVSSFFDLFNDLSNFRFKIQSLFWDETKKNLFKETVQDIISEKEYAIQREAYLKKRLQEIQIELFNIGRSMPQRWVGGTYYPGHGFESFSGDFLDEKDFEVDLVNKRFTFPVVDSTGKIIRPIKPEVLELDPDIEFSSSSSDNSELPTWYTKLEADLDSKKNIVKVHVPEEYKNQEDLKLDQFGQIVNRNEAANAMAKEQADNLKKVTVPPKSSTGIATHSVSDSGQTKYSFKDTKSTFIISNESVNNNNIDINYLNEQEKISSDISASIVTSEIARNISSSSSSNESVSSNILPISSANRRGGLLVSNINYASNIFTQMSNITGYLERSGISNQNYRPPYFHFFDENESRRWFDSLDPDIQSILVNISTNSETGGNYYIDKSECTNSEDNIKSTLWIVLKRRYGEAFTGNLAFLKLITAEELKMILDKWIRNPVVCDLNRVPRSFEDIDINLDDIDWGEECIGSSGKEEAVEEPKEEDMSSDSDSDDD